MFWAKAAATAVHLINRSPSSAIEFDIPEERWTTATPDLKGLRRFGCLAYIHSSEGKLSPRAKKSIFLGYPDGVKGYKVWVLEEERCSLSRNVIFKEDVMYKDIIAEATSGKERNDKTRDGGKTLSLDLEGNEEKGVGSNLGGVTHQEGLTRVSDESDQDEEESIEESTTEDLRGYQLARDRVRREVRPSVRLEDYTVYPENEDIAGYAYMVIEDGGRLEPQSFQEALEDPDKDLWLGSSDEEMTSLKKNKTWVLVDRVRSQRPIGCKWVFKRKPGILGVEAPRFKARLVAKGYSQKEGIDYQEIFSPVAKHVSIRLLLSAVVHFNMELEQMDVKTAFLNGNLEETIYMEQPEGYVDKDHPEKVCLLKKSLYGLKQSPRQWNTRFHDFMMEKGYIRSEYDICFYFKQMLDGVYVYLLLYVDDMLIASLGKKHVCKLKEMLSLEFEMKDLGAAKKILGMEIVRDRKEGKLSISQSEYLQKVLDKFGLDQSKGTQTPLGAHFHLRSATEKEEAEQRDKMKLIPYQNAVGSLMYAMIGTRPDIAYAVGMVCRFMSKPLKEHWLAVKWIMRYIKNSLDIKLCYTNKGEFVIEGYCDSDYAADLDRRRSISGMVFTAGGNVISWKSNLQKVVALSTTEAEYISLTEASKEAMWLKGFINEIGFKQEEVKLHCDSQSAIALAKNAVFHERTKHMSVKYHFIRDLVKEKLIQIQKISTLYNPADIFTKVLPIGKLKEALEFLRVSRS